MNFFSKETGFFGNYNPKELVEEFGSPLYVYNETILRQKCKEMNSILKGVKFKANYSTKANANLRILQIIREEGLSADAMSAGEIYILLKAGFKPEDIFYVCNNVSKEEMMVAIENNIMTSVDSLSQLDLFGKVNPGGRVAIRFNPLVGAGHHQKVITGGKNTKFGINPEEIETVKDILTKHRLTLAGINQHIGSLFMDGQAYIEGVESILRIANNFENLEFIDMGGGFGIPYNKQEGQMPLDIGILTEKLSEIVIRWMNDYGRAVKFKSEPGRYIVAEAGVLLGTVYAIKNNYEKKYIGTDLGFNNLMRPVLYESHHEIEVYRNGKLVDTGEKEIVDVVGNICETGDIMANSREIFIIEEGDTIGVMDAGAYGYCMSSNYNNRLRPAEILINQKGKAELIRRRDTFEDLMRNF